MPQEVPWELMPAECSGPNLSSPASFSSKRGVLGASWLLSGVRAFVLTVPCACRNPASPALFVSACPSPIDVSKPVNTNRCHLSSTDYAPAVKTSHAQLCSQRTPMIQGLVVSSGDPGSRNPPPAPLCGPQIYRFLPTTVL